MSPLSPYSPLPLISFDDVMNTPLPLVEWDVEPLIARGERVIFYGEFGSMKSWLLLDLGIHLAAGSSWLQQFNIPEARSVLYIDEEMNERVLRRRIHRLACGAGLEPYTLSFFALSRQGVCFDSVGAKNLLAALARSEFDPDIIIVETLRRVMMGKEAEASDVTTFWRNVELILKAGKTLILSHHMRKPRSKSDHAKRDRASGSTDILAGADTAFAVHRIRKDATTVECVKSRETEEPPMFIVPLDVKEPDGPARLLFGGSPSGSNADLPKLELAIQATVEFMDLQPARIATTGQIVDHLTGLSFAERTAQRVIPALVKQGHLISIARGHWAARQGAA